MVSILSLLDPLPWAVIPLLRHGGGGRRTEIVCGYMLLHRSAVRPRDAGAAVGVRRTAAERPAASGCGRASTTRSHDAVPRRTCRRAPIATRLPELVLTEVLRTHLATAPAIDHGWLAALRDPILAPALAAAARRPGRALDGRRAGADVGRVPLVARRPLPAGARSVADPLPHGMAHAPRRRAARDHRALGVHDRPARRLRLRGSVQPGVQARPRGVAPSHWRAATRTRNDALIARLAPSVTVRLVGQAS